MHINLVIPDPSAFVSGGNIYNSELLTILSDKDVTYTVLDIDAFLEEQPTPDVLLIDSLYFHRISQAHLAGASAFGLIHYLEVLEPGNEVAFQEQMTFLRNLDLCICPSQFIYNRLVTLGLKPERLLVIEPVASPMPRVTGPVSGKVRAIMVNNLTEIKGVREFLASLADASVPPDYRITIVGDTSRDHDYSEACQAIVRNDRNLSKTVRFMGLQSRESTVRLMQSSNLFISNSRFETFGIAIQEANQSGIPLLVRNGGNATTHVNEGINGHNAPDIDSLIKIFERLVNKPETFGKLQLSARQYFQPYSTMNSTSIEALVALLQ